MQVIPEENVQSEVEATIELVRVTTTIEMTSFLDFLQVMYRFNALISALSTNAVVYIAFGRVITDPTYYAPLTATEGSYFSSSCSEKSFLSPAVFYPQYVPVYTDIRVHSSWPIYGDMYINVSTLTRVDGFYGGCFPLDAVLASTLDCLYNIQCLNKWFSYFPGLNRVCMTYHSMNLA
jgi:hypothetical protein